MSTHRRFLIRVILCCLLCFDQVAPSLARAADSLPTDDGNKVTSSSEVMPSADYPGNGPIIDPQTSAIVFEEDKGSKSQAAPADPQSLQSQAENMTTGDGLDWADNKEALIGQLLDDQARIFDLYHLAEQRDGREAAMEKVNRGDFRMPLPGFGKAELTTVDGQLICRIVQDSTGVAFLLMERKVSPTDSQGIDPASKHLRQLVARQHIEAGEGREARDLSGNPILDKHGQPQKAIGRHVVKVWLIQGAFHKAEMEMKPEFHWNSARWWRDFFYSKWKKPTSSDFTMALFSGFVLQGILSASAMALKTHVTGSPFSWYPILLSSFYGVGIGTFISFYKNLSNTGQSRLRRVLQSSIVSVVYAYALVLGTHAGGWPGVWHDYMIHLPSSPLGPWVLHSLDALGMNAAIGLNILMNNYSKDFWYRITGFRTRFRENLGTVKLKFLKGTRFARQFDLKWNRSSLENQLIYMIPWTLNVLSLLGFSVAIAHSGIRIPVLQFMSIPLAQFLLTVYVKRIARKRLADPSTRAKGEEMMEYADALQKTWDRTWGLNVTELPGVIAGGVGLVGSKILMKVSNSLDPCLGEMENLSHSH